MSTFTASDVANMLGVQPGRAPGFTAEDVAGMLGVSAPQQQGLTSVLTGETTPRTLPAGPFSDPALEREMEVQRQRDAINAQIEQLAASYSPEQIAEGRKRAEALGPAAGGYMTDGPIPVWKPAWIDSKVARWMAEQEIHGQQGAMQPGKPITGPDAFAYEAGRAIGHLLPNQGPDAISRIGASLQDAPPTEGAFSTVGKAVGSAAASLAAIFVPGGQVALPAAFAAAAARESTDEGESGAVALGRGLLEGGSEFAGTILDIGILKGIARSIGVGGRDATRNVIVQTMKASAQAAGTEIAEEELNAAGNAVIDVAIGKATPAQALEAFKAAQPELLTVTGLAGALTGGGGVLARDVLGAGNSRVAYSTDQGVRPPQSASREMLDVGEPETRQAAQTAASAPAQSQPAPSVQPAVPSPQSTQPVADILAPRPDQVLGDGTALFMDRTKAEQSVRFRNERRTPGEHPYRMIEAMPGAAVPVYAVVPDTRLADAQARGEAQSAEVTEFAREAGKSRPDAVADRGADSFPSGLSPDKSAQESGGPTFQYSTPSTRQPLPATPLDPADIEASESLGQPATTPAATPAPSTPTPQQQSDSRSSESPVWFRGVNARNRDQSDRFYSASQEIAGEFAIDRPGDTPTIEQLEPGSAPKNPLVALDKPSLAKEIGYKGDPLAEPAGIETPFDVLAKRHAQERGHDAIVYESGTFDEPELHLFGSASPQPPATPPTEGDSVTVTPTDIDSIVAENVAFLKDAAALDRQLSEAERLGHNRKADRLRAQIDERDSSPDHPFGRLVDALIAQGLDEDAAQKRANELTKEAAKKARRAEREAKRPKNQAAESTEPTTVGEVRLVAGERMQAVRVRWGDQGVQHELWQSDDRERGAYRSVDTESGNVVSIMRGPFDTVRERWEKRIPGEPGVTETPAPSMSPEQRAKIEAEMQAAKEWDARVEAERTKPAPAFKKGDRVEYTDSRTGKTLTGTVRGAYTGEVTVDVDQIAVVGGGVPIGRIETVPTEMLRPMAETPVESPTEAPDEVQDQTREPERSPARGEPDDAGESGVARGEPGPPEGAPASEDGGRAAATPQSREPSRARDRAGDGEGSGRGSGDRARDADRRAEPDRDSDGEPVRAGERGERPAAAPPDSGRPSNVRDRNHRIAADHELAPRGLVGKIKANIKAIRLLQRLEAKDINPNPEQKKTLAQYVGWGGLSQALDEVKGERWREWVEDHEPAGRHWKKPDPSTEKWAKKWFDHYKALRELMSKSEFREAAETTLNAHYTSREVISEALWPIAERLGFRGGNVIETSAGIGHIIGLQPEASANTSRWTAVEIDGLSSRILKKLYPEARTLHTPFEKAALRNNTFDLVISNFPFASAGPGDKRYPRDFALHNYFFARSIDLVRPGGLVVSITSDSTMDRVRSKKFRVWMAERADLVGAIRLPNDAFKGNANTEVTTDVLIFRKKDGRQMEGSAPFIDAPMFDVGKGEETELNEYFHAHPDMMLGRMTLEGTMYRDKSPALVSTPGDLVEKIREAVAKLPADIAVLDPLKVEPNAIESTEDEYSFQVKDGVAGQVMDGVWKPIDSPTQEKRAAAYVDLREKTLGLIRAQLDESMSDSEVEKKRTALRKAYEAHVKKHGNIGDRGHTYLREDPDFSKVEALELVSRTVTMAKGKTKITLNFTPAPMLTERTQHPVKAPEKADNPDDAIGISMAWMGKIDLPYIARMLGTNEDAARRALLEQSDVYMDPQTGLIVQGDEYLSGNVREKLERAREQAKHDESLQRNVEALEKVQPEPISLADVDFTFGARWIPVEAYNQYLTEKFGAGPKVSKVEATGALVLNNYSYGAAARSTENQTKGGGGMTALEILNSMMGLRMPVVYDTVPDGKGGSKQVKNPDATIAAQSAAEDLRQDFVQWARTSEHVGTIEDRYNETYNTTVARRWSVPNIKHYPGAATTIELRDHQKAAVTRGVSQSYLNAHSVGTGKTFVEITTAMEWRRLGLAKKPLIVVQNATVEQVARSFAQLYPNARVLTPHKQTMNAKERKAFLNRIATGDWDSVILPQSFYDRLQDDPQRVNDYMQEQIDKLIDAVRDAGGNPDKPSRNDDPSVKNLQKRLKALRKKLEELTQRAVDEDALSFEQLGVDGLLVDEAHAYKKLQFFTEMEQVRGLDTGFSMRGLSMLMKARHVQERTGGRNTILLTGTPVTNTLAEAWSMMRYVRPDLLAKSNIAEFDDFATAFALTSTETEMDAVGRFKEITRLRHFVNVPELQAIWAEVADVVRAEDLDLPRPDLKGGGPQNIEIEPSKRTLVTMEGLIAEYERFENMSGKEKRENSHLPLTITGRARKAALDTRMLDPDAKMDPGSKLMRSIEEIHKRWVKYEKQKLTQVVFADLFRSGQDNAFNAFEEIRRVLVERGVTENQIAIIHEHDTKAKREALFERVNSGAVRVVMGTTEKLGVGVNIQTRLQALHHLDAPWRPSDMEQREGRIVRQGNLVPELIGEGVEILRYGVKRTFDAGQYERLARKQKMINDVLSGRAAGRSVEDAGEEVVASFAEASAAFSGDPRVKQLNDLRIEIRKLEAAERGHRTDVINAQRKLTDWKRSIPEMRASAKTLRALHEKYGGSFDDPTIKTPEGKTGAKALQDFMDAQVADLSEYAEDHPAMYHRRPIGTVEIAGIPFEAIAQGKGTDVGRLSPKHSGVSLSHMAGGGHIIGSDVQHGKSVEWLLNNIRADIKYLLTKAQSDERTAAERESQLADIEAFAAKKFPQAERLDAAQAEHDKLLGELEAEAKPAKPNDGGPTSAPETGPERSYRPIDRIYDALDALEQRAQNRRRRRSLPRGGNIGGTIIPEELADLAIIGAAKFLKGTIRFREWSKQMQAEFGERVKGHVRDLWNSSRDLAQDIIDGMENPQPTIERVRERIAGSDEKGPKKGSTPETRAVHVAYKAGLKAMKDQLPALRAQIKQAESDKGKARAATIQGIRREIRRLVEDNLPPAFRGRFLPELTNAKTLNDLSRAVNKIRRELARAQGLAAYRRVQVMRRLYLRLLSPDAESGTPPRERARQLIAQATRGMDKLKRTGRGVIPTDEMEEAADAVVEAHNELAGLVAMARFEREAFLAARVGTVAEHVETAVEAIRKQPKLTEREGSAEDIGTPLLKSALVRLDDLRLVATRIDGGKGTVWAVMFRNMRRAHEAYYAGLRDMSGRMDRLVHNAGYKSIAEAVGALSGRRGEGVTDRVEVTLGGRKLSIAKGELMGLYAMDPATRARIMPTIDAEGNITPGAPIQFQRGRHREPIAVTLREIDAAAKKLPAKDRELVDGLKELMEELRPALFEAHYRLKGFYPEQVLDYWPSKRNLRFSKDRGLPEGWQGVLDRYIENAGFLETRTGGKLPFVVGDVMSVAMEHIDASLKIIHVAEATRMAASVVLNPSVQAAVNERFGKTYNGITEDFLRAISLAQEADATTLGRAAQWMNQSLATSYLGANPGTWAKQLGGIPRLRAVMPHDAFWHGFSHWTGVKIEDLIENSGHFWMRYVGNIAGRFSPVGGESYADVARPEFLTAIDDAGKEIKAFMETGKASELGHAFKAMRHASATTLGMLNAFDAVNAKIAYAGWRHEAQKRYPDWSQAERDGWAMNKAWETVAETQNPSSVLDQSVMGMRAMGKGTSMFFLFTSDTVKARNRIVAGFRESKAEGLKQVEAEAYNIVWARAVGWGLGAGVGAAVIGALGGDWDEWRERFLSREKVLFDTGRDIVSLVDPVFAPSLYSAFKYGTGDILEPPAQGAIRDLIGSFGKAVGRGKKLPEGDKVDDFLLAIAEFLNEAVSVLGLNPARSVVGRVIRDADRLDEHDLPNVSLRAMRELRGLKAKARDDLTPAERKRIRQLDAYATTHHRPLATQIRTADERDTPEGRARAKRLRGLLEAEAKKVMD